MKIVNAKDKNMFEQTSALPDVSGGVSMLLQPIKLGIIKKTQVSGYTQEEVTWVCTQAARQAFTAEQLIIRPEGERSWKWFTIHMLVDAILHTDDIIIIHNTRMRIIEKLDYSEYGFVEYHAIEDYRTEIE